MARLSQELLRRKICGSGKFSVPFGGYMVLTDDSCSSLDVIFFTHVCLCVFFIACVLQCVISYIRVIDVCT